MELNSKETLPKDEFFLFYTDDENTPYIVSYDEDEDVYNGHDCKFKREFCDGWLPLPQRTDKNCYKIRLDTIDGNYVRHITENN